MHVNNDYKEFIFKTYFDLIVLVNLYLNYKFKKLRGKQVLEKSYLNPKN